MTAAGTRLLGIYAGVIFFLVCMTVLALHLITDSMDHRGQYKTLYQMGVEKKEIVKMVGMQSAIYFFLPCLTAFLAALSVINSFLIRYGHKVFTYMSSAGFRFALWIPVALVTGILICYYGTAVYMVKKELDKTLQ